MQRGDGKRNLAVLLALTAGLPAAAMAQDATAEDLRRELEALERRRAEILRALEEKPPTGEPRQAPPTPRPPRPEDIARPGLENGSLLEELTVVATRMAGESGETTVPISVLDGSWFEDRGVTAVSDGLRTLPGVTVTRSGVPGSATSVFLRGAGSNQVLVLQDGVPLNDPTIGGQFNFFDLDALALDRVEVLRGSYGVLYGSDAIGGVVNLVSRRGSGEPRFRASAGYGSFGTHRETLTGSGGDADSDWSFGIGRTDTDGPEDREAFESASFASRVGVRAGGDGRLEFTSRWIGSRAEDRHDFGAVLTEDPNIERRRDLLALGTSFEKPLASWITARFHGSLTEIDSEFRNGPDTPGIANEFRSTSRGRTLLLGAMARARVLEESRDEVALSVIAGFEHEREDSVSASQSPFGAGLDIDKRTENRGAYALVTFGVGPLTLNGGARRDHHSQFGKEWSPQAGARFDIAATDTVVRANYGEGFRAPTPAETSDPFIGEPDLKPETSESVDFGVEQDLGGGLTAEVTWFRLRTRDLIAFNGTTFLLDNITRTEVEGVESSLRADLGRGWAARAGYTRQRARDLSAGTDLLNRPRHVASAGVEWKRGDWTLSLDALRHGSVPSAVVTGPDQRYRDHPGRRTVVDLSARWRASDAWTLFARIDNLLDAGYVETSTSPRGTPVGFFLGATFDF